MIKISDPDEEELYYQSIPMSRKSREFQHTVAQRGVYEMCFQVVEGRNPVRVFIHVDYKPLTPEGIDKSRTLSKDDVPTLQSELLVIERQIKEISVEIDHARRQEAYLNQANGNFTLSIHFALSTFRTFTRIYKISILIIYRDGFKPYSVVQCPVYCSIVGRQLVANYLFT